MNIIEIFLASSKELEEERRMMGNLANTLNTVLKPLGIQVIVVKWEDLDASMGVEHKQEEYNKKLRECEMCMVLYWSNFGEFTKREFDIAYEGLTAGNNPRKLYVYFKDGEKEPTQELKEFRDSFPTKYGHFFSTFKNIDTLITHFLLQFMDYQSQILKEHNIVELRDGKVLVGGKEYISLQNVPFAGNNETYNKLKEDILELEDDLAELDPDNPRYKKKSEKLYNLKEELKSLESGLWDTALEITKLCSQKCSERLQRAMDYFNQGDNKAAAAILKENEIYKDAQQNINLIKLGREGLLVNIEELLLKIKLLSPSVYYQKVVNAAYEEISAILTNVIEYASIAYGKYSKEVLEFCKLSRIYFGDQPRRQLPFFARAMEIAKRIYLVDEVEEIISIYRDIAWAYEEHDFTDYDVRIQCKHSVVELTYKKYGGQSEKYIDAVVYYSEVLYWKDAADSKLWFHKALSACRNIKNIEKEKKILKRKILDLSTINSEWEWLESLMARYKELSSIEEILYACIDIARTVNNDMAKKYYEEALLYASELNDIEAQGKIFGGLSRVYGELKNFDKQIEFLKRSISITGGKCDWFIYDALANAYLHKANYPAAIECAYKSLNIVLKERSSIGIVRSYNNLCMAYKNLKDYDTAADCLLKAIETNKQNIVCYENLAKLYAETSQPEKALEVYCVLIKNEELVCCDSKKAEILGKMGWAYYLSEELSKAEQCYKNSIELYLNDQPNKEYAKQADINHSNASIAEAYDNIAKFYAITNQYTKAQEALDQSYAFCKNPRRMGLAGRSFWQGVIFRGIGEYQKAMEIFKREPNADREKSVRTEIALTLLEWGKLTKALDIARKVATEHPDYAYVHEVLGRIYKELNDIETAKAEFETSITLMEENHIPSLAIKKVKEQMNAL